MKKLLKLSLVHPAGMIRINTDTISSYLKSDVDSGTYIISTERNEKGINIVRHVTETIYEIDKLIFGDESPNDLGNYWSNLVDQCADFIPFRAVYDNFLKTTNRTGQEYSQKKFSKNLRDACSKNGFEIKDYKNRTLKNKLMIKIQKSGEEKPSV